MCVLSCRRTVVMGVLVFAHTPLSSFQRSSTYFYIYIFHSKKSVAVAVPKRVTLERCRRYLRSEPGNMPFGVDSFFVTE